MDQDQLKNIVGIRKPKTKIIYDSYLDEFHAFCQPNNFIHTVENSIIGSGPVKESLFIVVILKNGQKICLHLVTNDPIDKPQLTNDLE